MVIGLSSSRHALGVSSCWESLEPHLRPSTISSTRSQDAEIRIEEEHGKATALWESAALALADVVLQAQARQQGASTGRATEAY